MKNAAVNISVDWARQRYAETYVINGRTYGIEDYSQPGDHFFPEKPHKRFKLWAGGCGIGDHDSLDEARKMLHAYAYSHVNAEYHGHQERAVSAQRALQKLGGDPFNLGRFRA